MYAIVESSCGPFEDKVQCYMLYSVRKFDFRHSLMNKRHNELERVQSQVNDPQYQMMDLLTFNGLDSETAPFLLENFRIIVCAILHRKSSEDNEGADSILLKTIFELTTAISRKSKKTRK